MIGKSNCDTGEINYFQAQLIVTTLVNQGIQHAVISPGSRSTPLTLACERNPQIQTWIHFDERSAAFFALGLATRKQQPVIVIATSGSAICHWLAAITEANHSCVPLLFLSADRPNELQHVGANQTIDQVNLFQNQVRYFFQLAEQAFSDNELRQRISHAFSLSIYPKPGPVHINIPIREPLLPHADSSETLEQKFHSIDRQVNQLAKPLALHFPSLNHTPEPSKLGEIAEYISAQPGLIICGRMNYSANEIKQLELLAERLDCPILADPLSHIRLNHHSDRVIYNYDTFLNVPHIEQLAHPQWIIRFGTAPISKSLSQYLQTLSCCRQILVNPYGDFPDPLFLSSEFVYGSNLQVIISLCTLLKQTESSYSSQLLQEWKSLESQTGQIIQQHFYSPSEPECMEAVVIREVLEQLKSGGTLFSANSMCIRDLDTFIYQNRLLGPHDEAIKIIANRGCSGIDGNVSSFLGLIANADSNLPQIALMGDLTTLHDSNGLLWSKVLKAKNISAVIIILNNHGGAIFNYLPQNQLDCFEKAWITDPALSFAHLATLYELDFHQLNRSSDFANVLSDAIQYPGISLVEVLIDQKQSVHQHNMLKSHIQSL